MPKNLKVVVVGDGAVGKTCLLWSYAKKEIPPEYVPTVFDNYVVHLEVNGEEVHLQLWDTAGQEELENIRILSYTNTDVFLVCFSVCDPNSYENVQNIWLKELKKHVQNPVYLLVGTKSDLRNDDATLQSLAQTGKSPVTHQAGEKLANEIKAIGYVECSAIKQEGVKEVFDAAMKHALKPKKKGCVLI
ncbi:Cdc42 homolog, putative [Trichomonas vaginalis G3]|uniref:Cdc42 homolog, putative n=1 Tax=Trichomonas vaginalis (strain ATCC PRA-98 / G3) TaxID=412133 RepID=A2EWS4_TRIV3|nr:small GTPase mediated signal transduction [Trichomonas vaginalis G3]EAY02904.1 Cdc42 homolog, putative [Trichomonas vaginalis G3]KAI5551274.1 small GTPase mediated signal transduction [Trichomonas vaginalis G3]|eukprot:XP_001315127.1 Cdc42 homolog [Trichomonas vaginalis G3]